MSKSCNVLAFSANFFCVLSLPIHGSSLSSLWATLKCITSIVRRNQNELWNDRCTHEVTHTSVQCDEDYFSGPFWNLCSMFKVMGFILRRCINMATIIMHHEMFNVRKRSFRTNVQSNNFHCRASLVALYVVTWTWLQQYSFQESPKQSPGTKRSCFIGDAFDIHQKTWFERFQCEKQTKLQNQQSTFLHG
jgi:hypothetical protein